MGEHRLPGLDSVVDRVRRRRTGAGEPVQADVGQQLVPVDGLFRQLVDRVGPLGELLHDPGQLPDRRIVQRVRQRLRPRRLQHEVPEAVVERLVEPLHPRPIRLRQALHRERSSERRARAHPSQMCADHVRRIHHRQHPGNPGPRVRAVSGVPLVPEPAHQLGPHLRRPEEVEPTRPERRGEPVPRQRRYDDVERVGRVTAVRRRIGQPADHLLEFHRRPRPPVREDQRQRVRRRRPLVEEVDPLTVDLGRELRDLVQRGLRGPPVVAVGPVSGELLEVGDRNPAAPVVHGRSGRPPRRGQPRLEVVHLRLRDLDPEGPDVRVRCHAFRLETIAASFLPQ